MKKASKYTPSLNLSTLLNFCRRFEASIAQSNVEFFYKQNIPVCKYEKNVSIVIVTSIRIHTDVLESELRKQTNSIEILHKTAFAHA